MPRLCRPLLLLLVGIASSIPSPVVARQLTPDWIQAAYERRVRDEPSNPELFFEIAATYWDAAYRDKTLAVSQKRELIGKGLVSVDRALTLKPDNREALIRQAEELREKADLLPPLAR